MNVAAHRSINEMGIYARFGSMARPKEARFEENGYGSVKLLVEWLNNLFPDLNLRSETSEEELRDCLIDGIVLCGILNKLRPGLIDMRTNFRPIPGVDYLARFLDAMDEMGLLRFVYEDIQQGYMLPVLQCLGTLKEHLEKADIHSNSRRRWDAHEAEFSNRVDHSQRNSSLNLDKFATNGGDMQWSSIDGANQHEPSARNKLSGVLKQGLSADLSDNYITELTKLSSVDNEETDAEEKQRQQDLASMKEEKMCMENENSALKSELEAMKKTHEEHCLQLEAQAEKTKHTLEKRSRDLERFLVESNKRVKQLESLSESNLEGWKKKEETFKRFLDNQQRALQELRAAYASIKQEMGMTKRRYAEQFFGMGMELEGVVHAAENYHSVLAENRKLYNEVQDLKGNIRVYCRVRPFLPGQSKKLTSIEYISENGELLVSNPTKPGKDTRKMFKFNKVYGPAATQEEVFLDTQPLIRTVLDGFNVCIFAYGQTGSGKTYTMSGPNISSKEGWGVNYRALHDLFQIAQSRKGSMTYEIGVQMVEIYNEQVRDLLTCHGSQKRLGIWSTTQPNGLAVPDASMHQVTSTEDVLELMNIGLMNRVVGATALNERSSRSHSILTIHVRGMDLESGTLLRGNLHLVDLAGSERVDRSEVTGDRMREAQHINKSLSALGDVIFALAQKSQHVPYRNSKLTQVLQSSLGGQAKTLMFVQLNPDLDSYFETLSTLKFAERVSRVELGAARSNKEGRDIRELADQVTSLKEMIAKKDEEIERLQVLKINTNGLKSVRFESSPRRFSVGNPRYISPKSPREMDICSEYSPKSPGRITSPLSHKEMDICSEFSGRRHSYVRSLPSMDGSKHRRRDSVANSKPMIARRDLHASHQSKIPGAKAIQKDPKEDIDQLFGFGSGDSDERISDISDGGLSDGSPAEDTLFPEPASSSDSTSPPSRIPNSVESTRLPSTSSFAQTARPTRPQHENANLERRVVVATSKLPKPSQKAVPQTRLSRLSLHNNKPPPIPKFQSSIPTTTSAYKKATITVGNSSASRSVRQTGMRTELK